MRARALLRPRASFLCLLACTNAACKGARVRSQSRRTGLARGHDASGRPPSLFMRVFVNRRGQQECNESIASITGVHHQASLHRRRLPGCCGRPFLYITHPPVVCPLGPSLLSYVLLLPFDRVLRSRLTLVSFFSVFLTFPSTASSALLQLFLKFVIFCSMFGKLLVCQRCL